MYATLNDELEFSVCLICRIISNLNVKASKMLYEKVQQINFGLYLPYQRKSETWYYDLIRVRLNNNKRWNMLLISNFEYFLMLQAQNYRSRGIKKN